MPMLLEKEDYQTHFTLTPKVDKDMQKTNKRKAIDQVPW
jgi:hypothetical protein